MRLFFPRSSSHSFASLENDFGMGPENILVDRSRIAKFGGMSCRFSGIEPEKTLHDRPSSISITKVWLRMNYGKVLVTTQM